MRSANTLTNAQEICRNAWYSLEERTCELCKGDISGSSPEKREKDSFPGHCPAEDNGTMVLAKPGQLDPPVWASSSSRFSLLVKRRERDTCVHLRGIINHLGNYSSLKSASH